MFEDLDLEPHLAALRTSPPTRLWHYTSAASFAAILRSNVLRATHVRYLNDLRELEHARKLVTDRVYEQGYRLANELTSEREMPEHWAVKDRTDKAASVLEKNFDKGDVWAFSVSEVADDLSQWRAYGGGGDRYAIGFDSTALKRLCPPLPDDGGAVRGLFRVAYTGAEKNNLITALATWVRANLRTRERTQAEVVALVRSVAALLKDPAFAAEREWRFVVASHDAPACIDVVERNGRLRPFIAIEPETDSEGKCLRLPIVAVIVLPESDRNRAVAATKLLLRARGYIDGVDVRLSKVPFTGL